MDKNDWVAAQIALIPTIKYTDECREELGDLWEQGMQRGDSTGLRNLDELYTLIPGQLTIATGWPGSGKSEFIDQIAVNLARNGWKTVFFSPENFPQQMHVAKLVAKWCGKPFEDGPTQRLSKAEMHDAMLDLNSRFGFITPAAGEGSGPEEILNASSHWFIANAMDSKRLLVLDPWNCLMHSPNKGESETLYVSRVLQMIRRWARANEVHVILAAHPQKMRTPEGELPIPRPDMISGSQHFWNVADNCFAVHRLQQSGIISEVEIYIQKIRFRNVGQTGKAIMRYNRPVGSYSAVDLGTGEI